VGRAFVRVRATVSTLRRACCAACPSHPTPYPLRLSIPAQDDQGQASGASSPSSPRIQADRRALLVVGRVEAGSGGPAPADVLASLPGADARFRGRERNEYTRPTPVLLQSDDVRELRDRASTDSTSGWRSIRSSVRKSSDVERSQPYDGWIQMLDSEGLTQQLRHVRGMWGKKIHEASASPRISPPNVDSAERRIGAGSSARLGFEDRPPLILSSRPSPLLSPELSAPAADASSPIDEFGDEETSIFQQLSDLQVSAIAIVTQSKILVNDL